MGQQTEGNFIKKETLVQVFPVNFAKFIRTPFLQNTFSGCFCTLLVYLAKGFVEKAQGLPLLENYFLVYYSR